MDTRRLPLITNTFGGLVARGTRETLLFPAVAATGFALALSVAFYAQWVGWNQPIIDQHGFRQTQTALSTYWLLHGGNWLNYETPVFGSPWSIPMEFPLYQWIVAMVAWATPLGLDQAGRMVSQIFFLLCLWPLCSICRELRLRRETWLATAALLLMSPVYLFWSRTFMIESTALFLSVAFVASYLRWINTGSPVAALGTLFFLTSALLVKVTTAIPFGALAAALSIAPAVEKLRERDLRTLAVRGSVAILVAVLGLMALIAWTTHANAVKAANIFGSSLTSQSTFEWTFGSFQQRTSFQFWSGIITGRALSESLGNIASVVVVILIARVATFRTAHLAISFLLAWLAAFLIFTNLHIVHNYYQYANAILLIVAAGILIGESARTRPALAACAIVIVLALQFWTFNEGYGRLLTRDFSQSPLLRVARLVQQETPPGTAIIVATYDWSPVIAYYSQRKSLTFPNWADGESLEQFAASPSSFVFPLDISAVVVCPGQSPPLVGQAASRSIVELKMRRIASVQGCEVALAR